jgi:PAS domain S-box-containing protein
MNNDDKRFKKILEENEKLRNTINLIQSFSNQPVSNTNPVDYSSFYKTLVETSSFSYSLMDTEGKILFCNNNKARLYGYDSIIDLIGKNARTFIAPEHLDLAEKLQKELFEQKHTSYYGVLLLKKNGDKFYGEISLSLIEDKDGKALYILTLVNDVTERINSESLLKETSARNSALLDAIPDLMFLQNFNGDYLDYHCTNEELLISKPAEFLGKNMKDILPEELYKSFRSAFDKIIETGRPQIVGYPLILEEQDYFFEARFVKCGENEIISIIRDMTAIKEFENRLKKAISVSEKMSKLKSDFLANISHEIRTPLNGIQGFTDILYSDITNESQREMLRDIKLSGKRLLETLDSILDMSRISSNQVDIKLRRIDMDEFIRDVINHHSPSARKKRLVLNFISNKRPDGTIDAMLDSNLLKTIMNNLINNAIKYTQKGEIVIELASLLYDAKEFIEIKVKDTGIGIKEENINLIFDEFRQESEGINRYYEGVGLGLSVTKKYIELLGGNISVESKLGEGTVFTLRLPSGKTTSGWIYGRTGISRANLEKAGNPKSNIEGLKKVLYVEDDFLSQQIVEAFLKDICKLDVVSNGKSALSKLSANSYDLILMDINLGKDFSGIDTINEVKRMDNYKNVPIIAVTAYTQKGDREEILSHGCADYISKPLNRKAFLNSIKRHLNITSV